MRVTKYNTYLDDDKKCYLIKEKSINYQIEKRKFDNPDIICKLMRDVFSVDKLSEEYLYMLCFDTKLKLIGVFEISHGSVSASIGSTREIMQKALMCNAVRIALTHNHPSGDTEPSKADDEVTIKVKNASKLMDITFLDHIIIGENQYYSYRRDSALLN